MEAKLAHIKLKDILISETNKMFRDESELTNEALKEHIDSIRDKGVIQPVLLRFLTGNKLYELVAGERRYRSMLAICAEDPARDTIPAYIRDLTKEEAFELQVIENLERKDVHPLKEAYAYKYLVDKDPNLNTVAELALRFAKTEHYISTRLKLNDLIPEAKKDFADNIMSLGHALLIARLTPEDQKKTIEQCTDYYMDEKKKVRFYQTISDLEGHINDDVICNLSTAAFKKDDATLVPKAGPCTTCSKRSGANQLFADVKEKDRCFDRACFLSKRIRYVATQLPELIETEPDLAILYSARAKTTDPSIEKVLKSTKVKVLRPNADYETYNYGNRSKINGIYINGEDVGRRVVVFSSKEKAPAKKGTSPEQVNVKEAIARIKERTERAVELDQEKIYGRILEALGQHATQKNIQCDASYYNKSEDVFLRYIIWDKLGYTEKKELAKLLKIKTEKPADLYKFLEGMTHQQVMYMMRHVMLSQYGTNMPNADFAYIIKAIAWAYKDIPIKTFEDEQAAIRKTREERATLRIKALQPTKENAKPKSTAKKKAKPKQSFHKGLSVLLSQE